MTIQAPDSKKSLTPPKRSSSAPVVGVWAFVPAISETRLIGAASRSRTPPRRTGPRPRQARKGQTRGRWHAPQASSWYGVGSDAVQIRQQVQGACDHDRRAEAARTLDSRMGVGDHVDMLEVRAREL